MSRKIVSVDTEAAKEKAVEVGKRAARAVSRKVSNVGGAVKERASRTGQAAVGKLADAGIKATQKQQEVLEKLKDRVSDS